MTNTSRNGILESAAKALAWELHAAAGYGRTRTRISVDRFDRELRSAAKSWNAIHKNLKQRRKSSGNKNA